MTKLIIRTISAFTVATIITATAVAQETKTQDHKPTESKTANSPRNHRAQQQAPGMPAPSPEMVRLANAFVGRWSVTGKQASGPDAPTGDSGTGKEFLHRGPGGQSLVSDLHMDFEKAGRFAGHGVLYWDAAAKAYKGFWCESASPVCEPAGTGHWEGDKLIFEGDVMMNGARVSTRQTYSDITHNSFTWTMEVNDPGGMKPLLTFNYKRLSRSSSNDAAVEEPPKMLKDERAVKTK